MAAVATSATAQQAPVFIDSPAGEDTEHTVSKGWRVVGGYDAGRICRPCRCWHKECSIGQEVGCWVRCVSDKEMTSAESIDSLSGGAQGYAPFLHLQRGQRVQKFGIAYAWD